MQQNTTSQSSSINQLSLSCEKRELDKQTVQMMQLAPHLRDVPIIQIRQFFLNVTSLYGKTYTGNLPSR